MLINFILIVRNILRVIVDQRLILSNIEVSNLITNAYEDLKEDFQSIENKILEFGEHQLVKERLFGNSVYFKMGLVKGLLDSRDPLFLNDFKNSQIFAHDQNVMMVFRKFQWYYFQLLLQKYPIC